MKHGNKNKGMYKHTEKIVVNYPRTTEHIVKVMRTGAQCDALPLKDSLDDF